MLALNNIIISGIRFKISDNVKNVIQHKCEKLLKHQRLISSLRFELQKNLNSSTNQYEFAVTGHMKIKGLVSVFHAESDSVYKSIDELISKLDRSIRKDSRILKKQRRYNKDPNLPVQKIIDNN
ncbi:MAG: ribosome-associated translation inhibitor RaiA [Crocinitomicaceae bacterium]|jgi:putative sigma-54 modulation protein|nr:ribosome-associated translation inhibitor RaiA [Crocinitomicaceae bacterium]